MAEDQPQTQPTQGTPSPANNPGVTSVSNTPKTPPAQANTNTKPAPEPEPEIEVSPDPAAATYPDTAANVEAQKTQRANPSPQQQVSESSPSPNLDSSPSSNSTGVGGSASVVAPAKPVVDPNKPLPGSYANNMAPADEHFVTAPGVDANAVEADESSQASSKSPAKGPVELGQPTSKPVKSKKSEENDMNKNDPQQSDSNGMGTTMVIIYAATLLVLIPLIAYLFFNSRFWDSQASEIRFDGTGDSGGLVIGE